MQARNIETPSQPQLPHSATASFTSSMQAFFKGAVSLRSTGHGIGVLVLDETPYMIRSYYLCCCIHVNEPAIFSHCVHPDDSSSLTSSRQEYFWFSQTPIQVYFLAKNPKKFLAINNFFVNETKSRHPNKHLFH